ncbi:hypothetical protein SAMD00019534_011870 [Acytostelium subglobosum LB1]|uniref:hypothetical protein n=1 Tax=Acytostelium subglobosum LB1 TaxID=1410327 RepID=UPI000644EDE1|nr:hypothetical protein SAMD00019534_011870 [Acytostelium subglobosum LB1]GAM18012.1 hypothetical protein SAMD00019534_011870 [Acytostelium subglobosum LB1]|eukprot:XP_012758608.1 hypothetical protein SAMD00019534_011870 [Acytostelium subglobosum LB1]
MGNTTMNSTAIASYGLNKLWVVHILDNQPPHTDESTFIYPAGQRMVINGTEVIEYSGYGSPCFIDIIFSATDNYYGIRLLSTDSNAEQNGESGKITTLSGNYLNGQFRASTYMLSRANISSVYLYDEAFNMQSINLKTPLHCGVGVKNVSTIVSVTPVSTSFNLDNPDFLIPEPTLDILFQVNNFKSYKASYSQPFSLPWSPVSENLVMRQIAFVPTSSTSPSQLVIGRIITTGNQSETLQFTFDSTQQFTLTRSIASAPDSGPTISVITLTHPRPGGYNNFNLNKESGVMPLLLNFTVTFPEQILYIEVSEGTNQRSFIDSNIMIKLTSPSTYSSWIQFPLYIEATTIPTTFNLTYYSSSGQLHGPFTITTNLIASNNPSTDPTSNYIGYTANPTNGGQADPELALKYSLTFTDPLITKRRSDTLAIRYGGIDYPFGNDFMFPYGVIKGTPLSRVYTSFTSLPSMPDITMIPTIDSITVPFTAITLPSNNSEILDTAAPTAIVNFNMTSKRMNIDVSDDLSGVGQCYIEFPLVIKGLTVYPKDALPITSFNRMTFDLDISSVLDPLLCPSFYSVGCSDRLRNTDLTMNTRLTCPPYFGPVPTKVNTKYINRNTIRFDVRYINVNEPYQVTLTLTTSSSTTSSSIDVPLTVSKQLFNSTMFAAVGDYSIPSNQLTSKYNISLNFQLKSGQNYSVPYSSLQILLRNVMTTNPPYSYPSLTSAQTTLYNPADSNAPTLSVQTTAQMVTVSTFDPSGVASLEFTYFTSFDMTPRVINKFNNDSNVAPTFTFDIPQSTDAAYQGTGTMTYYCHPSKVCDVYANCQEFTYNDFSLNTQITFGGTPLTSTLEISRFDFIPKMLYPFNNNQTYRTFNFTVDVKSTTLAISDKINPIVYVEDKYQWQATKRSATMTRSSNSTATLATYTASVTLPRTMGLDGVQFSVFGVTDVGGNILGMSQYELDKAFPGKSRLLGIVTGCASPCLQGAQCVNGNCQCPPGFWGDFCQFKDCPNNCSNIGICISSGYCSCPEGFAGVDCSFKIVVLPTFNVTHTGDAPSFLIEANGLYEGTSDTPTIIDHKFSFGVTATHIQELDSQENVVNTIDLSNMTVTESASKVEMLLVTANGARVNVTTILTGAKNYSQIEWLNETITMVPQTVKITFVIDRYTFAHRDNILLFTWDFTMHNYGSECVEDWDLDPLLYPANDSFSFIDLPYYSYRLLGRYPTRGLADGRPFSLRNYLRDVSGPNITVGMAVPSFNYTLWLDPDFSVIVRLA